MRSYQIRRGNKTAEQPKKATLPFHCVSTSKNKQYIFNFQITRFIVDSNTAFLQVESKQFEKLITTLRPGTRVQSRKQVSDTFLDEVYDEEKVNVVKNIEGSNATLGPDYWSTKTNDPVIGVTLSTANQVLHANTIDTTGNPHTSDYLAQLFKEEVERRGKEWKVNITALVTDNAANMSGMRTLVKEPMSFCILMVVRPI